MATVEAASRYIRPSERTPRTAASPIDDQIRDLRLRGMSYAGIAIALEVYCGWRLTPRQVTYRCQQMGWHRRGRPHARLGMRTA